jgi:putative aldouronate transport system permease protein
MMNDALVPTVKSGKVGIGAKNPLYRAQRKSVWKRILKERWLYIMAIPGIAFFIIFRYFPFWGIIISFQDYNPFLGVTGSPWVGLKHFIRFFNEPTFLMLLRNTLLIGLYNLIFFFPAPIILALLLNEIRSRAYKRAIQTMVYVPHFMSWVVVVGISYVFFTTEGGLVNNLIQSLGGTKVPFLLSETWFRPLIVLQVIWKETGWGTIIFLAALANVDPQLYESSFLDGASRWQQLWYITLPSIRSTIVVLLILRLGNFLDTGFDQIYNMVNAMNREVGEVFDTYVYTVGIRQGQYSYSIAVGLFKSVVALILVLGANAVSRKVGEEGIL